MSKLASIKPHPKKKKKNNIYNDATGCMKLIEMWYSIDV